MNKITTKIDPASGLMTISKSGGSASRFFTGADLGAGVKADLRQPYKNSVWVLAAVRWVANPISAVPLAFTLDKRGGDVALDDPALNAFWELPAQNHAGPMSRTAFVFATSAWLQLAGEAFWVMDDSWLDPRSKKNPLILARPDRMHEICDRDSGELVGWQFQDGYGHVQNLIPEQVVHHKLFNPYDDVRGLAPWAAAKIAAESDFAAGVFAKHLSENNGDRGPFVISDGSPSPEQIEQVTRVLREKRIMSRRGEFRTAFLAAPGMKVENPDVQAVDAAFVGQRLENRHEVFIAFGVPPSMASLTANYSVGSASDRFLLIEETCKPMGGLIAEGVERVSQIFSRQKRTLFAEFDFDEHSTMQQVRAERFKVATEGVDRGMPWATANEYLKLGLPEFPGWEVGRVPFNLAEIEAEAPAVVPDPEPETDDTLEEMKRLFRCHAHGPQHARKNRAKEMQDGDPPAERDPKRIALWVAMLRLRAPWVKRFESRFNRHLMLARGETLSKLEANFEKSGAKSAAERKAGILELIFDLGKFLRDFTSGMQDVSRNAMETAGAEMWEDELGHDPSDDPMTMPSAEVMTMVQARQNHLSGAGVDIWNEVRDTIGDGIEEGVPLDEITDRVRSTFNGISQERAKRIAVTEVTAAYEAGRYLTLLEAGIEWKEWLSSGDERVRDTHEQADGDTIPIREFFQIGEAKLLYPGMTGGPASEVINCRCMIVAGKKPDES